MDFGSVQFSRIARSNVNLPVAVRLAELVVITSSPLRIASSGQIETCEVVINSSGCKGEQNLASCFYHQIEKKTK